MPTWHWVLEVCQGVGPILIAGLTVVLIVIYRRQSRIMAEQSESLEKTASAMDEQGRAAEEMTKAMAAQAHDYVPPVV